MRTRLFAAISLALMLVMAAGCAKVPTETVDAVRTAMDAARSAEAGAYAKDAMAAADQAVAAMDEEMKAQEGKFVLLRSFGKTKELAAAAQVAADAAANAGREGKARTRDEATTAINDAKAAAESARAVLDTAVLGKGSAADIEAMKQDLMAVMTSLTEADAAFSAEDYLGAKAKAEAAMASAQGIEQAVAQAKEMAKGRH